MSSLVLAINAGSSSLKFQLIRMPEETLVTKGLIERIGIKDSIFTIEVNGEKIKDVKDIKDHEEAINIMLDSFKQHGIIDDINDIAGTGHRVVHGGELFPTSALVTDKVEEQIESLSELAPLHNPANLMGIRAFRKLLPKIPHVAVFDTSFHQSMPEQSYLYSLPYQYYKDYGIRKYGFHGTSHKYVSQRAAEIMNKPIEELRIISCHIGNGASIAAIDGGESIDTSMGFTPLAGLQMGTRTGDIDASLIPFLMNKLGIKEVSEMIDIFNKKSGTLGVSGVSSDMRDVEEAAEAGNERAQLALDMFNSRVQKYIGQYIAVMNGVDIIVFTAGIGENSKETREAIIEGISWFGCELDTEKNNTRDEAIISKDGSKITVINIPTDEEREIARDVERLK